jgi:hypothetical protein
VISSGGNAHFSGATSCSNLPMFPTRPTPDPSSTRHPLDRNEVSVFMVCSIAIRRLGQAISGRGRDICSDAQAIGP